MKLDAFTIFLIILGLLVVVAVFMNYTIAKRKETFVNFQNNQPSSYGTNVYIPQYSSDSTQSVLSLYDNLYFDTQNATLIEVYSPSCPEGQTGALCKDLTGASISEITVVPRDGLSLTSYPSGPLKRDGTVTPFSTPQSQQKSVNPAYNQFTYTTTCDTTNLYQVFYVSWYTNTYLHLIDLSGGNAGRNIKTFNLSATGLVDTVTYPTGSMLSPFTKSPPALNDSNNNTSAADSNYLKGAVKLYQLAALTTSNTTIRLLYDITNGNIVVNLGTGTYNVYNRAGTGAPANPNTIKNDAPFTEITKTNTFMITDLPNVVVLVLAYKYDTIISVITSRGDTTEYKMIYSYRFNQSSLVNNSSSDSENVSPTTPPSSTASPTASPTASLMPIGASDVASAPLNSISNLNSQNSTTSAVCGDDLSCKWYWYFNTIAQNTNGVNYLSDDYFLKTEAIPPVCPQCPQCPSGEGACTSCGGNGGCGSMIATTAPSTSKSHSASHSLTPSTNPKLPAGAVTDSSGNTYIPYTDSSGNTRYVLYLNAQGTKQQQERDQKQGSQVGQGKQGNMTVVDKDGQFISTADPDTLGGGLAISTMSFDQLGTAGFNAVGGVANNVVNTAGNVVGGTVNSATNLVGGVANTGANLVGGVANGVTNLVGGVVGTAADLAKGAGSGLMNLGNQNGVNGVNGVNSQWNQQQGQGGIQQQGIQQQGGIQQQQGGQSTGSSLGYTPFGPTPGSTFGNIPGQTPIDNYSYYGATQSKGGNYMPITADFSAFGK